MIKKMHSFQMYRWRAYRSHGCRKKGAYKPHCQLMNRMIRRLPLRIRDPHMNLQPIQYEMHLCVFLPIHWCTNLWSKLILSKSTKFEEDWDKNSMKDPIFSTFSCKKLNSRNERKQNLKDTVCDFFLKPSFSKSGFQQLKFLLHL